MQETDGQGPEVLAYTQMQVHTHNEQDCTLDKNDHTVHCGSTPTMSRTAHLTRMTTQSLPTSSTVRTDCP
eukprot:1152051-Pelagomonas_calceolata.AAC.2